MKLKIDIVKICNYCKVEFLAHKTTTRFCSNKCSNRAYKTNQRNLKVQQSNEQTQQIKNKPIEDLRAKEFLTVREVASLLSCSVRSVYYFINNGVFNSVNLGQRVSRIRRTEIDRIFDKPKAIQKSEPKPQAKPKEYTIEDCYTISEVQTKFNISPTGLHGILKRNNVPKLYQGRYTYVPKTIINRLFKK